MLPQVSVKFDRKRLNQIKKTLGYMAGASFIRTLITADYERWYAARLKQESATPVANRRTYWTRYIRRGGESDSKYALSAKPVFNKGWQVKREEKASSVTLSVSHLLLTSSFGKYGKDRFYSIMEGSLAQRHFAKRYFTYKYGRGRKDWRTVKQGQPFDQGATEPLGLEPKMSAYVKNWLQPQLEKAIAQDVERRMRAA